MSGEGMRETEDGRSWAEDGSGVASSFVGKRKIGSWEIKDEGEGVKENRRLDVNVKKEKRESRKKGELGKTRREK